MFLHFLKASFLLGMMYDWLFRQAQDRCWLLAFSCWRHVWLSSHRHPELVSGSPEKRMLDT